MTNPVLTRNTTVLRGTGATVQGIALITLLYLGFVVSAAMMAWQHPELFAPHIIPLTFAGLGVATIYIIDLIAWFVFDTNVPLLHENSIAGITVSVVIICIATARLFVDYEVVTRAVEQGVDAKYEPYYAFGLTVTLIWLYLEILRLIGKTRSRK